MTGKTEPNSLSHSAKINKEKSIIYPGKKIPEFTEQDAENLSIQLFGIKCTAARFPGERDQNFLLKKEPEKSFILKIANSDEKEINLDFQNRAMAHLNKKLKKTMCPQVIPSLDKKNITTIYGFNNTPHYIRMLTYIPGVPLAEVNPKKSEIFFELGQFIGETALTLRSFSHPGSKRKLIWDMKNGAEVVNRYKKYSDTTEKLQLIEKYLSLWENRAVPVLPDLNKSIVHNDANNYNIIVSLPAKNPKSFGKRKINGIIDFGDIVHTYTLCELSIACSYGMFDQKYPIASASKIIAGYNSVFTLTENELNILFPMICLRLCMSLAISSYNSKQNPDNEYLQISHKSAWNLLKKLDKIEPDLAGCFFRDAAALSPCPNAGRIVSWIRNHRKNIAPVISSELTKPERSLTFDLSVGSKLIKNPKQISNPENLTNLLFTELKKNNKRFGIGKYNETRVIYTSSVFKSAENELEEGRTVHLGIDIFIHPGTAIHSPFASTVHSFQDNSNSLDYGPTIILKHEPGNDILFYTLYGHLSKKSLKKLYVGKKIKRGEKIADVGDCKVNGGWPPHLHFQIITNILSKQGNFPGVAKHSEKQVWLSVSPDPNLILGIPEKNLTSDKLTIDKIINLRKSHLGKSMSLSYKKHLWIVRGFMQYMYDNNGKTFLDAVNNVPHVGHCNPKVVEAASKQMSVLNTNTRYLHENIVRYAKRLCDTMPPPLKICYIVNSGSEANDLALRMAAVYTGQKDFIVVDGAYHGNLGSCIDISPYKFDGPGGCGKPKYTHKTIMPCRYQGPYKYGALDAGKKYAKHIKKALSDIESQNRKVSAFICESLLGCGGQIILPDNYLRHAYRHIRNADGICIADEVQVGFGRVGEKFWGFQTQNVVPDIVTVGKPMGDGHPLAAVITTPEIAERFNTGMEYFNTYGGNPVSCAIGLKVLDIIEQDNLQENSLKVGSRLKKELNCLKQKYPLIGDVRGMGLFLGIELVLDRNTRKQAPDHAAYIAERMMEEGILISTDGPFHNVLKIKPPIVFNKKNADLFLDILEKIFQEDPVRI